MNYDPNLPPAGLPTRYTTGIGGTGRATQLADIAAGRAAYDPDMTDANNARTAQINGMGSQSDSLAMARAAAMGTAPSRAELLGQNMIDGSLQAQLAGAAGARGGAMAQAAAMRNAAQGAGAMQAQGTQQLSAMRAQEMANARDQYGQQANALTGQAGAMRGQDINTATLFSNNENAQRTLNQQGQLGFNQQSIDIDKANAANSVAQYGIDSQNWQNWQNNAAARQQQESDISQHSTDRESNFIGAVVGGAATTGAALLPKMLSDERAKMDIVNLGADARAKTPSMGSTAASAFGAGAHAYGQSFTTPLYNTREHTMLSDEDAKIPFPLSMVGGNQGHGVGGGIELGAGGGMSHADLMRAGSGLGSAQPVPGMVGGGGVTGGYVNTGENGGMPGFMMSDERAKHTMGSAAMMADANRALAPSAYEYKSQFTPPDQAPGEMNVGPMAQNMERSPIAATAVKRGPDGMLMVDQGKALRLALGGVGSAQEQLDQQNAQLAHVAFEQQRMEAELRRRRGGR